MSYFHADSTTSPLSSAASSRRTSFHSLHSVTTNASTVIDPALGNPPPPQPTMPARLPSQPSSAQIYDALEKEQEAIVNRLQRELSMLREEQQRSRSPVPSSPSHHRRTESSSSSSLSRRASSRSVIRGSIPANAISDTEDATPTYPGMIHRHTSSVSSIQPSIHQPLSSSPRRSSRRSFGSTSGLSSAEDLYLSSIRKENETLKKRLAEMARTLSDKDTEIDSLKKALEKVKIDNENAIAD
ncbi:hypothetical protein V1512DRAFT_120789 [Lipomyces arxii]|uniref:uncharacterized protein n=1 Tax=Lipomyces arxii TaxID=56418 RepID=UPI0034CF6A83